MKKEDVYKRLWKEYQKCWPNDLELMDTHVYPKDVFFESDIELLRRNIIPQMLEARHNEELWDGGYYQRHDNVQIPRFDEDGNQHHITTDITVLEESEAVDIIISRQKRELSALMRRLYSPDLDIEYTMKKLHSKKYLSVKELAEVFPGMSKSTQETLRGRLYDPLPYHQKVEGGKITYDRDEVEKWRENQHK